MSTATQPEQGLADREAGAMIHGERKGATCLVCGHHDRDPLSRELPFGSFRCRRCGAVNDVEAGIAPVRGHPAPAPVPTAVPGRMTVEVRPSESPAGSPYRGVAPETNPPTVIIRWSEARVSTVLWLAVSVLAVVLGLWLGGWLGWLLAIVFAIGAYAAVASLSTRWELRAKGERIELRRRGLPLLFSGVQVTAATVGGTSTGWVAPQAIRPTHAQHVQLVLRRKVVGSEGEELEYYGVGVVDEAGRYEEHALSTDADEARFLFQLLSGHVSAAVERAAVREALMAARRDR